MNLKEFRTLVRQTAAPMCHFIKDKRGNASVIFGLTSIPLAMIASMAVDYGNSVRIKNELQAAVDAGVLAAATAIANGEDNTSKTQIAEDTFFANLSDNTQSGFSATPNTTVSLPDKQVTMAVSVENSRMISTLLSNHVDINVTATAVVDKGNPICMLSLNKTANEALYMNGTADLVANGCSIHVNSNDPQALRQVGSGSGTADSFCVNGNYEGSNYTPMPNNNCRQEEDPLAENWANHWTAAAVDTSVCDYNSADFFPAGTTIELLQPGVYCGSFEVKNGDTAVLLEGGDSLYVFVNGDINIQAGGTLRNFALAADGLTAPAGFTLPTTADPAETSIIMTGNAPAGVFSVKSTGGNQGDVWLKAKSTGTFAGIALSQDPAVTLAGNDNHLITGGGEVEINGIVYFPVQPLKVTGGGVIGNTADQFAIIADTIEVEGNGTLIIKIGADYSAAGLPELPESSETVRLTQ
ncbi:MAG: pilus assembly protein [Rhizobiales bacterium]|nr:pilus assembly protein [Hyphomicrobiales bacterium]